MAKQDEAAVERPANWDEEVPAISELVRQLGEIERSAEQARTPLQWGVGDRVLALAPKAAPEGGRRTGARRMVAEVAAEVGLSVNTLSTYRFTAAAWPPESRRADVPWHWHWRLSHEEDRFEVIQRPDLTWAMLQDLVAVRREHRMASGETHSTTRAKEQPTVSAARARVRELDGLLKDALDEVDEDDAEVAAALDELAKVMRRVVRALMRRREAVEA